MSCEICWQSSLRQTDGRTDDLFARFADLPLILVSAVSSIVYVCQSTLYEDFER